MLPRKLFLTSAPLPRTFTPLPLRPRPSILTSCQPLSLQLKLPARAAYHRHRPRAPPRAPPKPYHYNRFQPPSSSRLQDLWRRYQPDHIIYYVAAGTVAVVFVAFNVEKTPVSGRWRFNWVSAERERQEGKKLYGRLMRQYRGRILGEERPETKAVKRVLERLVGSLVEGVEGDWGWEVCVVQDQEANAFVLPGGKIFVMTGILPFCKDEDGLAAVLGHEIAHTIAHHSAENMSRMSVFVTLTWLVTFIVEIPSDLSRTALDLVYNKPGSRKQESEADEIGLMMMSESCYDPNAAISVWQRMEAAEKYKTPQILSTHPSHHNRIGKLQALLPEALDKRAKSDCGYTSQFADDFRVAVREDGRNRSRRVQDPYGSRPQHDNDDWF